MASTLLARLRAPLPITVAALVVAAAIGGCGSSAGSSSNTISAPSNSTPAPTASTTRSVPAKAPAGSSQTASCKHGVEELSTLPAATKAKLLAICEKASGGDAAAARKAAAEACRELVNASPLPAGTTKDRALASCSKSAGK
jgi:hypothetical protein